MLVTLHESLQDSVIAREAADALEACVHCGFCLATCPTYLDSRDERDSPRGRLYLLKALLEDGSGSPAAQYHLDRCLTCRSCETTCPSGVAYGRVADAGRELLEVSQPRSGLNALQRWGLRTVVPRAALFSPLLKLGQLVRPLLPRAMRAQVPPRQARLALGDSRASATGGERKVILFEGCVQSAATPNTNLALRHILARLGITVIETPAQGCCGALNTHLAAGKAGQDDMRRNIDAWWPAIESGVEAVLVNASGCAAQVHDYGHALQNCATHSEKARRVSDLMQDPAVFLAAQDWEGVKLSLPEAGRIAVHVPCTQQHALPHGSAVTDLLLKLGAQLCSTRDDHLCCGSAGTYSVLQPEISERLRDRKVAALGADNPDLIVTANIGCQLHLAPRRSGAQSPPVRHWLEVVAEAMA